MSRIFSGQHDRDLSSGGPSGICSTRWRAAGTVFKRNDQLLRATLRWARSLRGRRNRPNPPEDGGSGRDPEGDGVHLSAVRSRGSGAFQPFAGKGEIEGCGLHSPGMRGVCRDGSLFDWRQTTNPAGCAGHSIHCGIHGTGFVSGDGGPGGSVLLAGRQFRITFREVSHRIRW